MCAIMSPLRSLFNLFVAVLCTSVVLAEAQTNQSVCQNGGVNYLCPTVTSEFNRWGITFRAFAPYPIVQDSVVSDSSLSLTGTMDSLMVNISAYLQGANVNKTLIPFVFPQVLQVTNTSRMTYILRQALPYDLSSPQPTNPSVQLSNTSPNTQRAVLWWHDPPTDENITRHHEMLNAILTFHNVSFLPIVWWWASWTAPGSNEYYNEVWTVIRDPPPLLKSGKPTWSLPSDPTSAALSMA